MESLLPDLNETCVPKSVSLNTFILKKHRHNMNKLFAYYKSIESDVCHFTGISVLAVSLLITYSTVASRCVA